MGAGLNDLKPAEVLLGGCRFRDSIPYGILNADRGGADEFDFPVGMVAHE